MIALALLSIATLSLTASLVPLARRLAWRWNLVDHPASGPHKSHQRPIPYGGGVAIFLGLVLALLGGWLSGALPGKMGASGFLVGSAGTLVLLGLLDDWRGLSPLPRFAIQLLAAAVLVAACPEFRLALWVEEPLLGAALSAMWIAAMTNAFNFLDNMDGLSGGVAAIALLVLGLMGLYTQCLSAALLGLALSGAAVGFLLYNFPPASIFMGDAGGLLLGFVAGSLSAQLSRECSEDLFFPAPLLVLLVPAYDLASVVLIRLRRGAPPWRGDHNHLSHRLVRLGLSRRGAVLVIYLITLGTGLAALGALRSGSHWPLLGVGFLALIGAGLEFAARGRLLQA